MSSIWGLFRPQMRHSVKQESGLDSSLTVLNSANLSPIQHLYIIVQCLIGVRREREWRAGARGALSPVFRLLDDPRVVCARFSAAAAKFCSGSSRLVSVVGVRLESQLQNTHATLSYLLSIYWAKMYIISLKVWTTHPPHRQGLTPAQGWELYQV